MTQQKSHPMPWWPRDFAADEHVLLMTMEAEGVYRRLLDHQWLHGSIPDDLDQLAALCKQMPVKRFRALWLSVVPCFVPVVDQPGRLVNQRLERVRAEAEAYRAAKARGGRAGADAAWAEGQQRYVYAMRRLSDGAIKIGLSRSPTRRAAVLSRAGAELQLLAFAPGTFNLERQAQVDLATWRIGTEWFSDTAPVRDWIATHLGGTPNNGDAIGNTAGNANGKARSNQWPPTPSPSPTPFQKDSSLEEGAERQEPPAPVSLPYLVQCVKALNAGLAENPRLNGYREVSASEQAGTVTWEGEGIPVALACATIRRIARAYKPKSTSRQPSSLRYFDAAVREEFTGEKKQGQAAPALGKWDNPHKDRSPGALTVSLADLAPRRGQEPIADVLARIVPTAPEAA
jgi:uncharacterized protein YdaU (DUF1376 family)